VSQVLLFVEIGLTSFVKSSFGQIWSQSCVALAIDVRKLKVY
jgi:hypothetical protein